MDPIWTWGGRFFGFRSGDSLFTYSGAEAGRFHGDEVYGANGRYLGELMNGRLIRSRSKTSSARGSFSPTRGGSYAPYAAYAGYAMYAGYEDFPGPESF